MKRAITATVLLLLLLLAAVLWGNRVLERILDAELAALLSREIGIEVSLAPIRTELRTMTAHSQRLVMGPADQPAVVAQDVAVSVDWRSLLHGEVRLVYASASSLMLQLANWPGNDDPWPADYNFLEPILPTELELASGRYVTAGGESVEVGQLLWQRSQGGASLAWQQQLNQRAIDFTAQLASLDELLQLSRLQLQLGLQHSDDKSSAISAGLDLQPGATSGYQLHADIASGDTRVRLETGNAVAWKLPDRSTTHIPLLDLGAVRQLIDAYSKPKREHDHSTDPLSAALPRLDLIRHSGAVNIDAARWQDETVTDIQLRFDTSDNGIALPAFSCAGPTGQLKGKASVVSSPDGWQISLLADIAATGTDQRLTKAYLGNDWLWDTGHADLRGSGNTWETLLESLQGGLELAGKHRNAVDTPVTISATLDSQPGRVTLQDLDIRIAGGSIQGAVSLAGNEPRRLEGSVQARQLNLDFLIPAEEDTSEPGLPLPTFVDAFPGIDLDWKLAVDDLEAGDIQLARVAASLSRSAEKATLSAEIVGKHYGKLDMLLKGSAREDGQSDVSLRIDLNNVDLQQIFERATGLLEVRTSGSIVTSARGKGLAPILRSMRGRADLVAEMRSDGNWQRAADDAEKTTIQGDAALVLAQDRIVGLRIENLALEAFAQNLAGNLSMQSGREPWLIADLTSNRLDLDRLADLAQKLPGNDNTTSSLQTLHDLGNTQVSLQVRSVTIHGRTLPSVTVAYLAKQDSLRLTKLEVDSGSGSLTGRGDINWKGKTAALTLVMALDNLSPGEFIEELRSSGAQPLSGSLELSSEGASIAELLQGLTGDINLRDSPRPGQAPASSRREVVMTARKTADGMEAEVKRLHWDDTDLSGQLHIIDTTPPSFDITLSGGSLSLLPWQAPTEESENTTREEEDTLRKMSRTARAGADFVGDLILTPFTWLSGPREAVPGERLFSNTPLPFDTLGKYRITVNGKLGRVVTREATMTDVTLALSMAEGKLRGQLDAGQYNQGSAGLDLHLDTTVQPASVAAKGTFRDLHSTDKPDSFTRSGHFDVNSQGNSTAELAANLDGIAYLELGPGSLDYSELRLLTADVATELFRDLIPGLEKKQPHLECATTLGVFTRGQGLTPYGYAARTRQANLAGRIKMDLAKEIIQMDFTSSNRTGVGISVSSVFSNTVEIEGPLTNPRVVPNTTGLLWRSWAAVMTGGLSVIGESMFKRMLASDNPCESVKKHIREDFCPKNAAAAASPMICPPK